LQDWFLKFFLGLTKVGGHVRSVAIITVVLTITSGAKAGGAEDLQTCTYQAYKWSVRFKRAVAVKTIQHAYLDLRPDEIDPAGGCTVCEEDQETVHLPPLPSFRVCKKIAPQIHAVLHELLLSGEPIYEVVGYRVGRTRGNPDEHGNRTRFSNHAYGIAIDINPQQNGLYDQCLNFSPNCRLIRGGPWRPGRPGTLTSESTIVKAMGAVGFRWGGQIQGRQKDFMHFSPSGY
jgi:hypothetical protein